MRMKNSRERGPYQKLTGYLMRNYPMIMSTGRFVRWSLTTLKNTFLGIGGIFLFVVAGLYGAGALIEPLRWYLVGIATALLLLGGGLLTLSYARLWLNRFTSDQHRSIQSVRDQSIRDSIRDRTQSKATIDGLKKALRASEATLAELKKEVKTIKDDVFLIGYDILKEQSKLAERVSNLETQPSNYRRADQPPNDTIE